MKETHAKVFNILKASQTRGMLLDVAGGDGGFASRLRETGYNAIFCDMYRPERIHALFVQADMNSAIPFKANSFHTVTCMESLQYLENHKLLFRELAGILKKAGRLFITMPNILNLSSRLYFLNRGYFKYFKPFKRNREGREWDRIIYSPISFVEVFQLLDLNGFRIEMLYASRYRYREWPLFLIYTALNRVLSAFKSDEREGMFSRLLASKEILLGDHIIIIAKKN